MVSINVIGLTLLGLFGIFILQKKAKEMFDYLMLVMASLMAVLLVTDIQLSTEITSWSIACEMLIPYFLIAVFALYTRSLLAPNFKFTPSHILFFLPGLVATTWVLWDMGTHAYDSAMLDTLCHSPNSAYRLVKLGYQVFSIGVLIHILLQVKRHQESLKNNLSFIDPYQLKWLGHLSWIYLAVIVITMLTFGSRNAGIFEGNGGWTHSIVNISMVMGVSLCCYQGIRQYSWEFFKQIETASEEPIPTSRVVEPGKYEHSSLSEEDMEDMYHQLLHLFEEQRVYLEPKLCVQSLADHLQVTPHSLSQTINSKTGQPFYDFVNGYRVAHLKKLLQDPSHQTFTILALGLESGFNSKASLNRIFKNHTGMTPSAFQRKVQSEGFPSKPSHSLG